MAKPRQDKLKLDQFGRNLALLLNRAGMYNADHPYVKQAVDSTYESALSLLKNISPLVFILNQEQFFVDEEPLDPRVNVARIVAQFKKKDIQSLSFEKGLEKREIKALVDIYASPHKYPNAESIKRALRSKRVQHVKVNHVFYKKVTEDEEIVARKALKLLNPDLSEEAQLRSKKMFIDALLESVLTEEFLKSLSIKNLVENPEKFSKDMVKADLQTAELTESKGGTGAPGPVLLHQLELLGEELEKNLEKSMLDLSELAGAVMEMKRQLMEAVEAQKAIGTAYANEKEIVEKANEITDKVLVRLIKEEYREGSISVPRLGQIIRRLVPDPDELKRLLPKIKQGLLEEGMPIEDYLELVQELGKELKSEELARILEQSSEQIGVDGKELIEEVKRNPAQAAELIYLAAELRKEAGDEGALSEMLVEYIERLGGKMALDTAKEGGLEGDEHLKKVMSEIQTKILKHLETKEMKDEVLVRLEEKLNQRMDEALEKLREEWLRTHSEIPEEKEYEELSVLQTLEQSVNENDELGEILKSIRKRVEAGEIDENDFAQIHREISREKERRAARRAESRVPAGILEKDSLLIFLEKEMARYLRYDTSCSVLAFSLVKAKPRVEAPKGTLSKQDIIEEVLHRLARALRDTDVIGQLGRNKLLAILPMTPVDHARLAMRRVVRQIHTNPIMVNDVPLDVRIAGVAVAVEVEDVREMDRFLKGLTNQLTDMATRIKNIHAYL